MEGVHVIDLFCGAGGFSHGAGMAGAKPSLAVDCWQDALNVHSSHYPDCVHWCESMGDDPQAFAHRLNMFIDQLPPGSRVHLHASPPCQNLSAVNFKRDESEGMRLVNWALEVIGATNCDSWTMEQMYEHGLPCSRKRVIMSSHNISLPKSRSPTIKSITSHYDIPEQFTSGHTGGTGVYNGIKSIDGTSTAMFCVTSSSPRGYVDGKAKRLPVPVMSLLQSFPETYFPLGDKSRKMIGNAFPPLISKLIMEKMYAPVDPVPALQ